MQGERGESRFVSNTVALVLQTVAATLLALVQVKLLSNFLTKDMFGLFASLRGLSLLLATLAANGLPQLLVRFIPVHESRRERLEAVRLVGLSVAGSSVCLVVAALAAHAPGRWAFHFVPASALSGELYVWFYAMTLGTTLKVILYGGLNGLRRFPVQVLLETLSLLAVLVWIVVDRHELTLPLLLRILGIVELVTVGVGFPFFLVALRTATRRGRRDPVGARAGYRGEYASYFGWAVGLSLVAIAFSDADRYLIAQVLSLELLAAFHIAARVGRLANRLIGVSNLAFQPEVTRLDAEGRDGRVVQSARIFLKFNTVFAVWLTALLVVFAREAIVLVSSEDYTNAVPLLVILALSLPLTTMTAPITTVMKALDQVRGALWCDLVWAVCYVALILLLAPEMGLVGVGCAHVAACGAQLLLAVRLSRLPFGLGDVARLAGALAAAAGVAFVPALFAGVFFESASPYAMVGVKALLFLLGMVAFRSLVRLLHVFDVAEDKTLTAVLESRRLGAIGWAVGLRQNR